MDCTHDSRLSHLVASWSCHLGVHRRERANEFLGGHDALVWSGGPNASCRDLVAAVSARQSGNRAFDEYRQETLQRLEEEQREFQEFLARLRMAKDKAEFDQFMAERRTRSDPSSRENSGPSSSSQN